MVVQQSSQLMVIRRWSDVLSMRPCLSNSSSRHRSSTSSRRRRSDAERHIVAADTTPDSDPAPTGRPADSDRLATRTSPPPAAVAAATSFADPSNQIRFVVKM